MNSIWNKNLSRFRQRFPDLAKMMENQICFFEKYAGTENEKSILCPFWEISSAKNGEITSKENSILLHSAYNPQREAENLINSRKDEIKSAKAIVFEGFGLFYAPKIAANLFPQKTIILIEPDINHFLSAMLFVDAEELFLHNSIIFACGASTEQTITLINQFGILNSVFFSSTAQISHAQPYFSELSELIQRNRNKEKINNATLEKFRALWFRNSRRNIYKTAILEGVNIYKNRAKNLPFLVLGAGPSLQKILPRLNELKSKMVIVCVDTALRALLQQKVQPDFIVLTDPQYWAYRHIAGLKSPESILITENSVYPSVFKFECKKIVCCQSQIPVAQFFEKYCGEQGYLGAGGSVASCAWTFAKFCGAKNIFLCGIDLSFPEKQTHIKGSTFEQKIYTTSTKIKPAETAAMTLLFGGNASWEKDFYGKPVLSDKRMKMFAWWFESNIASSPETKTFTLSPEGLFIPGVEIFELKKLFDLPDIFPQKKEFLLSTQTAEEKSHREQGVKVAVKEFNAELQNALNICRDALKSLDAPNFNAEEYKTQLEKLKIASILQLVIPTNLNSLQENEQNAKIFKSIEEFCSKYFL